MTATEDLVYYFSGLSLLEERICKIPLHTLACTESAALSSLFLCTQNIISHNRHALGVFKVDM